MAIFFLTDGIGRAITRCWLNEREVSRLATRVSIPAVEHRTDMPPAVGWLKCCGSIDLLNTDEEGRFVAGPGGEPVTTRHYGVIKLIWGNNA